MPYPNIAMLNQASSGTLSSKVKIVGDKAATQGTEITMVERRRTWDGWWSCFK
jgi:hypothetical protein